MTYPYTLAVKAHVQDTNTRIGNKTNAMKTSNAQR